MTSLAMLTEDQQRAVAPACHTAVAIDDAGVIVGVLMVDFKARGLSCTTCVQRCAAVRLSWVAVSRRGEGIYGLLHTFMREQFDLDTIYAGEKGDPNAMAAYQQFGFKVSADAATGVASATTGVPAFVHQLQAVI